jgi:hypothetical protein
MSSTSTKRKKATDLATEAAEKYGRKTRTTTKDSAEETSAVSEKFANIEANPFFQVVMDTSLSPTQKKEEVAKLLAFDLESSKAENAARVQEFGTFKEWLMDQRKEMSKEIIRLSDTEAFAELKSVFDEMNGALLDFETQIKPLVEIIDAVNELNMASDGMMYDVFKEIQDDKAEEARLATLKEEQEKQLRDMQDEIGKIKGDNAALSEEKSFFGLGGTKKTALQDIARNEQRISDVQDRMRTLTSEIEETARGVNRESEFSEYAAQKEKLRELLDITSDEHKERQEGLVKAALNFVNTTEERTENVLGHMLGIKDQIGNVGDINGNMRKIYAVINEATKEAEEKNKSLTEQFASAAEGESDLARFEREDQHTAIVEHVDILTSSKIDTLATYGELQQESLNIKSMKDTNRQQIDQTKAMNSRGTAGVASRLSVVLTSVSSAALNESKTMAGNTLKGMNALTHEIAQTEAIKNAMGIHTQNDELAQAVEMLASYREVADSATSITREGTAKLKETLADIEKTAQELGDSVKKAKGASAEVMQSNDNDPTHTGFNRSARGEKGSDKAAPSRSNGTGPSLKNFDM